MKIERGDIWWMNLDPTIGAEIKKKRPCVILSANEINRIRATPVVVPLSSSPQAALQSFYQSPAPAKTPWPFWIRFVQSTKSVS